MRNKYGKREVEADFAGLFFVLGALLDDLGLEDEPLLEIHSLKSRWSNDRLLKRLIKQKPINIKEKKGERGDRRGNKKGKSAWPRDGPTLPNFPRGRTSILTGELPLRLLE
jgi:hypothetical protein